MNEFILITGGAGFIGSSLCETLLSKGESVIIYDSFNDFYDSSIKYNNVEKVSQCLTTECHAKPQLSVIKGDIRDFDKLSNVFIENKIKLTVHLAAMAGVRPSIKNPFLYNDVNVNGTLNLLELCKLYNTKKLIFASSSSVYGNNEKVPFSEADNVDYPISPYAATKKAGELICHTYHHLYDLDIACLRFFTVYGPRQRPDLAIHKFTKLIFEEEKIPFFGDGSTARDYTYIDDIIDGVTKAIDWVQTGSGLFEIFNLGESKTITLKSMVSTLEAAIGKKAKIDVQPMQPGDVAKTYADISKAKKILGYDPVMDFDEGISNFVRWYKKINKIKEYENVNSLV